MGVALAAVMGAETVFAGSGLTIGVAAGFIVPVDGEMVRGPGAAGPATGRDAALPGAKEADAFGAAAALTGAFSTRAGADFVGTT